jgi:hypothetical protein
MDAKIETLLTKAAVWCETPRLTLCGVLSFAALDR